MSGQQDNSKQIDGMAQIFHNGGGGITWGTHRVNRLVRSSELVQAIVNQKGNTCHVMFETNKQTRYSGLSKTCSVSESVMLETSINR